MRVPLTIFALALIATGSAVAQGARYRPSADTIHFQSLNSYLMYFVRGADTLGEPVSTTTNETWYLRKGAKGLELWTRLEGPGFSTQETYAITPEGRVTAVGGRPVTDFPIARVDVLPRLPSGARTLTPGLQWSDTVSIRGTRPFGSSYYSVVRTYRVARMIDTLNTTLGLLVAKGQMKLRQGGWQDSTQGLVWWQEVRGPVSDTVWFDEGAGTIVASFTVIDLTGTGGFGPLGGGVTMPSGLRSSVRMTRRP